MSSLTHYSGKNVLTKFSPLRLIILCVQTLAMRRMQCWAYPYRYTQQCNLVYEIQISGGAKFHM